MRVLGVKGRQATRAVGLALAVGAGLWLAGVPAGWAASSQVVATAQTAQQQLQAFIRDVHAATGVFSQTQPGGGAQQSGAFAFERPGRFRWEVRTPHEQLIVSDGQTVYQYDPDLEQATARPASGALGASPAALLFGDEPLEHSFDVQALPDADGLQWLRATPRSADAGFTHVDIGLRDGAPQRLLLLDAFGQTTTIRFSELKRNPDIPAAQFHFDVPQGVDLVRLGGS